MKILHYSFLLLACLLFPVSCSSDSTSPEVPEEKTNENLQSSAWDHVYRDGKLEYKSLTHISREVLIKGVPKNELASLFSNAPFNVWQPTESEIDFWKRYKYWVDEYDEILFYPQNMGGRTVFILDEKVVYAVEEWSCY